MAKGTSSRYLLLGTTDARAMSDSMVRYVTTSLFESPAQTLVNTVNTVGVMGKGIAAEFKRRYPEMHTAYRTFCQQRLLSVGKLYLYRTPNKWVLNFPTKQDWRHPSKVEWIEDGLKKFVATYTDQGITSVSFPMLGCGNGQLDWAVVRPLMEKYLQPLTIPVFVHVAGTRPTAPEHARTKAVAADLEARESISFLCFWNDLRRAAGQPAVSSLEDSGPEDSLVLPLEHGREAALPRDGFEDLFHMLRLRGALRITDYPVELYDHRDHVTQLLLHLPYVKVIEFLGSTGAHSQRGVQFALRPARSAVRVDAEAAPA